MNTLITLPDMTLEEATAKHQELKAIHGVARSMLLEMRDRKGWKVLGYSSWEEYGEKEWDYGKQYLYRLATASRIESIVSPIGEKQIPESQLRPLTQVPDDIKKQIWEQVNEENKVVTAKLIEEAVAVYKDLVKKESDEKETALKQKDEWRKQSLAERDAKREFEAELVLLRESKTEIVYVDDSKKVSEELKAELKKTKEKLKEAQKEIIEAIKKTREDIASGKDKNIKDLQTRETGMMSRIDYLQKELNKVDNISIAGSSHRKAQDRYRKALIEQAVALMVFDDYPPNDKQAVIWKKLLSDTQLMLNAQDLDSYQPINDYL
jgi:hypothetical protein